jgi:hypothetical protein
MLGLLADTVRAVRLPLGLVRGTVLAVRLVGVPRGTVLAVRLVGVLTGAVAVRFLFFQHSEERLHLHCVFWCHFAIQSSKQATSLEKMFAA